MLYDLVGVDSNWSNYGSHQGDNGEELPEETYFIFLNQTMGQRFSQVLSTSKIIYDVKAQMFFRNKIIIS